MSLIILHSQLSRAHPARATVGQIQNKLYAKATAPLMPGLCRSPGRQIYGMALNCVGLLLCPEENAVTGFVWKFGWLLPCASLNSYLHVDSFLKGGRARMEVVPTKIPTSPSRAAEEVSFRLIAVCLITVLFLCSADDTYILRHSHASSSKLVLTGSSPDSSWRNSSAHLSTTQLRETTD